MNSPSMWVSANWISTLKCSIMLIIVSSFEISVRLMLLHSGQDRPLFIHLLQNVWPHRIFLRFVLSLKLKQYQVRLVIML